MISVHATPARRVLLRTLTGCAAAILLTGFGGLTARAYADTDDKADKTKADKAVRQDNGIFSLGNDSIDPHQPIKPEFMINVSVEGEPDPSGNYTVDPAGNVSIRYAGIMTPISIKGKTPDEAADVIAKFLKTYIKNPHVLVTIVNVPRPIIFVGGAVRNTGQIIITPDTSLLDVLSKAEYTDNADLSQVRIIRREIVDGKDQPVTHYYNFEKFIKAKPGETIDDSQNPMLKDKDKIFVQPKVTPGTGSIGVFGEVAHPTRDIPLRAGTPMTVREVINLSGGATASADRHRVSIRRANLDRPLTIDLDKAEAGDLVNNIELKPDDTIYVEKLENNAYVQLNGGFIRPGKQVYDKRTTLTQAISEAGGLAPFAKEKEGTIIRHPDSDPKKTRIIAFNWKEITAGKSPDIELQPGDTVMIAPGVQPKPAIDIFGVLGGLTSAAYLYNSISGRRIY